MPSEITIREVGPRDGLQPEPPLSITDRVRLIELLVAAGLSHIEAVAFVSPKAVPAMAGAGEVFGRLPPADWVTWWALVPNLKGSELARAAGVRDLTVTVSASEEYSRRNVHMTVEESVTQAETIAEAVATADGDGTPGRVDVVISCAFGSPYEPEIEPASVADIVSRCRRAGTAVTLADTTGVASPRRVAAVLELTGTDVGLHFHDTRGTALLNAYAAMEFGVTRFDTAVGGLGGSPFATGAGGNLATEDLVNLCDELGIGTGVDLGVLLQATALAATLIGRPVPSRIAAAGPPGAGR